MNKSPPSFRFCFPSSRGVRLLGLLICIATLSLSSAETYKHDGQFVANNAPSVSRDVKRAKRADDGNPLNDVVQAQAAMIQTLQAEVAAVKAAVATLQHTSAKSVAFSARFGHDPINNVGVHATVKFDTVVFNQGGAYSPQTGVFTAPTPGIYVFFLNLMGGDTANGMNLGIIKSGTTLDYTFAEGGHSDAYDQSSCLTTTHLAAGEQVWVQHRGGDTSFRGGAYTTFSGFLLHADSQ